MHRLKGTIPAPFATGEHVNFIQKHESGWDRLHRLLCDNMTNTNSRETFDFYERQQRKLKKRGTVLQKTDRCTHIVHVKVMENMYSSRDFFNYHPRCHQTKPPCFYFISESTL